MTRLMGEEVTISLPVGKEKTMLPSPTPEAFLILAELAARTDHKPTKKCSAFRWRMRRNLRADNPKLVILRQAIPKLDDAREGAAVILCGSCMICPRREKCPCPVV